MGGRIGGVERRGAPYGAVVALAVETAQEEQALPKDLVLRRLGWKRGVGCYLGEKPKNICPRSPFQPAFGQVFGSSPGN